MGGDQDRTADELPYNHAERRNAAVCALLSFVLFVSFVVTQSILHVRFQAARSRTKNVANKRMHPSRRTVRFDIGEITLANLVIRDPE